MTARFLAEADIELREAARYYEGEVPGLGFAFVGEINRTLRLLAANPLLGTPLSKDMRKMPVRRFSYKLIYADKISMFKDRECGASGYPCNLQNHTYIFFPGEFSMVFPLLPKLVVGRAG